MVTILLRTLSVNHINIICRRDYTYIYMYVCILYIYFFHRGLNLDIERTETSFLNLVELIQIWIVITLFCLIWHWMELRLVLNLSERYNHNLNLVLWNLVLCVYNHGSAPKKILHRNLTKKTWITSWYLNHSVTLLYSFIDLNNLYIHLNVVINVSIGVFREVF